MQVCHRDGGNTGGICGYANIEHEEQIHRKPDVPGMYTPGGVRGGKLHKPPQVRTISVKPRNRLRKHIPPQPHVQEHSVSVFVLAYEPYPHSVEPGKVLGVFSTFNLVTSGAFAHGACKFSREGLLDGNEYLSPTGRIKLVRTTVQNNGVRVSVPEYSDSPRTIHVRLDIPHPEAPMDVSCQQTQEDEKRAGRSRVFLAVRAGPYATSWIGVFADKSLAWGACIKDKAMCAVSTTLSDETRTTGLNNLPQVTGRLVGSGRFTWMVEEHGVDDSKPALAESVRDV